MALMIRTAVAQLTFAITLATVAGQAVAAGALAIDSNKGGQYGFSYDHPSISMAEQRALKECGAGCQVVLRFDACGAYAADQSRGASAYGWGEATSATDAQNRAISECTSRGGSSCLVRSWGCNKQQEEKADITENLLSAAKSGSLSVVSQQLADGADVNAKDANGFSALHLAAFYGHAAIAELLIAGGANVNSTNNDNAVPLHAASKQGHKNIVELLIRKGANVNVKDTKGRTPIIYAIGHNHDDIAELLRQHGAIWKCSNFRPMNVTCLN